MTRTLPFATCGRTSAGDMREGPRVTHNYWPAVGLALHSQVTNPDYDVASFRFTM